MIFNKKGDCSQNSEALSKDGGYALGSIISKIHRYLYKDFGFQKVYQRLYRLYVVHAIDYYASVCWLETL